MSHSVCVTYAAYVLLKKVSRCFVDATGPFRAIWNTDGNEFQSPFHTTVRPKTVTEAFGMLHTRFLHVIAKKDFEKEARECRTTFDPTASQLVSWRPCYRCGTAVSQWPFLL